MSENIVKGARRWGWENTLAKRDAKGKRYAQTVLALGARVEGRATTEETDAVVRWSGGSYLLLVKCVVELKGQLIADLHSILGVSTNLPNNAYLCHFTVSRRVPTQGAFVTS